MTETMTETLSPISIRSRRCCKCETVDSCDKKISARLGELGRDYPRAQYTTFQRIHSDEHNRGAIKLLNAFPDCGDDESLYDDPDVDQSLVWCYDGGVWLIGPCGTGKTTLAICMAKLLIEGDCGDSSARLVNFRDLCAQARAAMTRGDRSDPVQDLIDANPEYLIIDDLGAEKATPWSREALARLVEARYRSRSYVPVIVTSNYTPSQLAKRLGGDEPIEGQRIVSRLREGALVIKLAGPDRRALGQTQLRLAS